MMCILSQKENDERIEQRVEFETANVNAANKFQLRQGVNARACWASDQLYAASPLTLARGRRKIAHYPQNDRPRA